MVKGQRLRGPSGGGGGQCGGGQEVGQERGPGGPCRAGKPPKSKFPVVHGPRVPVRFRKTQRDEGEKGELKVDVGGQKLAGARGPVGRGCRQHGRARTPEKRKRRSGGETRRIKAWCSSGSARSGPRPSSSLAGGRGPKARGPARTRNGLWDDQAWPEEEGRCMERGRGNEGAV